MTPSRRRHVVFALVAAATLCLALMLASSAMAKRPGPPPPPPPPWPTPMIPGYVTGDTHNHTQFSDGNQYLPSSYTRRSTSGASTGWAAPITAASGTATPTASSTGRTPWATDAATSGLGTACSTTGASFNALGASTRTRSFQGLEWGVPGIDESKTVIVDAYQMLGSTAPTYARGMGISDFEFLFDKLDDDFTQTKTLVRKLGADAGRTGVTKDPRPSTSMPAASKPRSSSTRYAGQQLLDPEPPLAGPAVDAARHPTLQRRRPDGVLRHGRHARLAEGAAVRGGYDEEIRSRPRTNRLTWSTGPHSGAHLRRRRLHHRQGRRRVGLPARRGPQVLGLQRL